MDDLVGRDGIRYKKFSEVPFTGQVEGIEQGSLKNGKNEGPWAVYWDNGQLFYKADYKNGKNEGSFVGYWDNGQLMAKGSFKNGLREGSWVDYNKYGSVSTDDTGTYKDGVKISD